MKICKVFVGLLLVSSAVFAQPAGRSPMIVVLRENVSLDAFARGAAPDARGAADPQGWGYLNRGVLGAVQALERRHVFQADQVFSHSVRGFAARLTASQIQQLELDSLVEFVEPDGVMTAIAQTLPWGIDKTDADISSTLAGNGSGAVTNAQVYVIDTGIDASHPDLNVNGHINFAGGPNNDCNGHGTHVAGTIGARDNTQYVVGMAPGVPMIGVKVLSCSGSGSTSGVIKGVDWVAGHAPTTGKPAVANMSLGGGASQALDNAVRNATSKGVFFALAAGNSGANACNSSPARAGAGTNNGIMTTAATDSLDREPSWSNYGNCVDIWAPGVSILSTKRGGGTTTLSGTSMASPHVAGAAALYRASNAAKTPTEVESAVRYFGRGATTTSKDGKQIRVVNAAAF